MTEEQNTEALKRARTFSDNKDKIDGFYNGYVQATIELQKENAELKRRLDNLFNSDCWTSEQLTKAKEIIKKLINNCCAYGATGRATVEAEQFLNGEVEK